MEPRIVDVVKKAFPDYSQAEQSEIQALFLRYAVLEVLNECSDEDLEKLDGKPLLSSLDILDLLRNAGCDDKERLEHMFNSFIETYGLVS